MGGHAPAEQVVEAAEWRRAGRASVPPAPCFQSHGIPWSGWLAGQPASAISNPLLALLRQASPCGTSYRLTKKNTGQRVYEFAAACKISETCLREANPGDQSAASRAEQVCLHQGSQAKERAPRQEYARQQQQPLLCYVMHGLINTPNCACCAPTCLAAFFATPNFLEHPMLEAPQFTKQAAGRNLTIGCEPPGWFMQQVLGKPRN